MDETDERLCELLSPNPRAPFRELADRLHISVQAVHRRIQILREMNVITGFRANVSLAYLGAVRVDVTGKSNCEAVDDVIKNLKVNDSVITTLVASGNFVYVNGLLRSITDLEAFVEFAKRAALIPDPRVALEAPDPRDVRRAARGEPWTPLSPLDLRIVRALHDDARKSTTDVADELGVSAVTVRRRLERMIQDRSIELTVDIDPTFSGDITSLFHITLAEGADKMKVGGTLVERYRPRIVYFIPFSNLPNFIVAATWTKTMAELKTLLDQVRREEGVKTVVSNIALAGYRFETWRDRLLNQEEPPLPAHAPSNRRLKEKTPAVRR